jgi:hypothetical protein
VKLASWRKIGEVMMLQKMIHHLDTLTVPLKYSMITAMELGSQGGIQLTTKDGFKKFTSQIKKSEIKDSQAYDT